MQCPLFFAANAKHPHGEGPAALHHQNAGGRPGQRFALKFSRSDESEGDYLGVQYMYAAGYDPNGAISIFEKLEALKRTRPGLAEKLFSTHPMDADRIDKTQKEIQRILPSKPEYVVTTSEYREMRARLIASENWRKSDANDGRPRLRVAPGSGKPDQQEDKDERPTIKRRDLME